MLKNPESPLPLRNLVHEGDALDAYSSWDTPTTIISDGAYGLAGFDGDPRTVDVLPDWYEPHIQAWSDAASPQTSLWFWNTEVGWATVHPRLIAHGWQYVQLVVWDKGIGHVAGNVNSSTIRRLPVVTEVSALYVRPVVFQHRGHDILTMQEWLRSEWKRAGLTVMEANTACGVKNAASRKYLTKDHRWYAPPQEAFEAMRAYANKHGDPAGRPYLEYSEDLKDGEASSWDQLRSTWNHQHGMTNVWQVPALRNAERMKSQDGRNLHTNQKPLELMKRQIGLTTNEGDVVWEPFGGTCSASVAAKSMGRHSFAAEMNPVFAQVARNRILSVALQENDNC